MIWSFETSAVAERELLVNLLERIQDERPVIVTDLHQRIVGVNRDWVVMCKYTAEEAFGRTPQLLQGPRTNRETALDFSLQLRGGHPSFASLINYKKDGTAFVNHIYGWTLGDLLVAETYAEHALEGEDEAAVGLG